MLKTFTKGEEKLLKGLKISFKNMTKQVDNNLINYI